MAAPRADPRGRAAPTATAGPARASTLSSAEDGQQEDASLVRSLTLWDGISVTVGLIIGAQQRARRALSC